MAATLKIVSAVVLALGVVLLVVLVALGGVVKKTVDDTIYNRLKYKYPKGARGNPDYEECYRATEGSFDEEYYLWNLTNPVQFTSGTEKPHFNLLGPYVYTQWYCNYNLSINKEQGYLSYRSTFDGYMFLEGDSIGTDQVQVTNINPGYLGILQRTGGDDQLLPVLYSAPGMDRIIKILQTPTAISLVWYQTFAAILADTNAEFLRFTSYNFATNLINTDVISADNFVDATYTNNGVESWAYYVNGLDITYNHTVSSGAAATIFADMIDATRFGTLVGMNTFQIYAKYYDWGVTEAQAGYLYSYIHTYLLALPAVADTAADTLYNQWANAPAATYKAGWEVGIPTATGIVKSDVIALFNESSTCALTNKVGAQMWAIIAAGNQTFANSPCATSFTLSTTQVDLITAWFGNYLAAAQATLLTMTQTTNWNDFAFAQWGGTAYVAKSVGSGVGLKQTSAEIGVTSPSCRFSAADAKTLLYNGTKPLTNVASLYELLSLLQVQAIGLVSAQWPQLNAANAGCFATYVQAQVAPYNGLDAFLAVVGQGGGLITTRTVQQWLFTAQDPIVKALTPSPPSASVVALVGNLTRTRAEADAEAAAGTRNLTYNRIYTGKNDLHWALMPWLDGEVIPYWNGTERVNGYNGTQFLPHGYLDGDFKEHNLTLWHRLINRTIPFQVVGKYKWDGVNVRYLAVADSALQSAAQNPANNLYYAKYAGAINKTSNPPRLPVFLTTPCFLSAEKAFSENVTWTDDIWFPTYDPTDKFSTHRLSLFIVAEPLLGSTLWGNLPIQVNFKYQPTTFYPRIGTGFAPVYWNAIGDKAKPKDLNTIKNSLYYGMSVWKVFIGVGVGVGVTMIVAGIVGLVLYRRSKGEKLTSSQG